MARWGSCDFRQIRDLQQRLEKMQRQNLKAFCEEAAKELASRLLAKVIKRTPVGRGTLRRGWTTGKIDRVGDSYQIEIINPVEYASDVEYGRSTKNQGWVPGRFMLTISEQELDTPKILEDKIQKYLRECLDDQ